MQRVPAWDLSEFTDLRWPFQEVCWDGQSPVTAAFSKGKCHEHWQVTDREE